MIKRYLVCSISYMTSDEILMKVTNRLIYYPVDSNNYGSFRILKLI